MRLSYFVLLVAANFVSLPANANPFYDSNLVRTAPIEVFERAIEAGVSATTWAGNIARASPLFVAAVEGRKDIVDLLVLHGADVNSPTIDGRSPIFQVALQGSVDMLRHLIELGAEVNLPGKSPLHAAMSEMSGADSPVKVQALIDAGARLDVIDDDGALPIGSAAANREFGIVLTEILINNGANLLDVAPNGRTLAAEAAFRYNIDVLRFIFASSPDALLQDKSIRPLMHYVAEGRISRPRDPSLQIETISFLIGAGVNLNAQDLTGTTILHLAAFGQNPALLEYLVQAGADPEIRDAGGRRPIDLARIGPLLGHPAFFALQEVSQ